MNISEFLDTVKKVMDGEYDVIKIVQGEESLCAILRDRESQEMINVKIGKEGNITIEGENYTVEQFNDNDGRISADLEGNTNDDRDDGR